MTESELRKMNSQDIIGYIQSAHSRTKEGVAPSEMIQMKQKIMLAALVLKEKFPSLTQAADKIINSFPGVEKPNLTIE